MAFPLVHGFVQSDDANVAFSGADYALLVGSRPRSKGMERKDLIEANAAIFSVQGKAINDHANPHVKVLVVGNPANTNCLIAQRNAPDVDPRQFTAMTRLDHNRAVAQLAAKAGKHISEVAGLCIWGNHFRDSISRSARSAGGQRRRYGSGEHGLVHGRVHSHGTAAGSCHHRSQRRSSAASAANAAIDHMHDWALW